MAEMCKPKCTGRSVYSRNVRLSYPNLSYILQFTTDLIKENGYTSKTKKKMQGSDDIRQKLFLMHTTPMI